MSRSSSRATRSISMADPGRTSARESTRSRTSSQPSEWDPRPSSRASSRASESRTSAGGKKSSYSLKNSQPGRTSWSPRDSSIGPSASDNDIGEQLGNINKSNKRVSRRLQAVLQLLMEAHSGVTERHLPYGITQCTCHPTQVNAPRLNPSQIKQHSIYLPRRDGRLS